MTHVTWIKILIIAGTVYWDLFMLIMKHVSVLADKFHVIYTFKCMEHISSWHAYTVVV
jgi:hypothetical protein